MTQKTVKAQQTEKTKPVKKEEAGSMNAKPVNLSEHLPVPRPGAAPRKVTKLECGTIREDY